ncbi:MAG: chloride channel protein, partial [Clostridia bacterium]|nr:chloride channel protein [Clostridia bacterium]
FGCVLAPILNLSPSFSAAVGMAALFAAVVNCPIASLILACEIFGSNGILLYAAAIFVSFTFSGYSSLYASQMFSFSKNCFETLNRKSK